jgi:serine/threonine-protein kinase
VGRVAIKNTLQPGTILARKIRVERVIGQGSMGIVLEATDLPLQRRIAVKVMLPERAKNEEARKRFLREARTAVRLSSEHVTRLIDVGELHDGTPYLMMEYLEGSTLEEILVRDGLPATDVAVDWIIQALDGVAEAHREGFVHRDLKPENLFLTQRPNGKPIVKVLDFGAVKDLVTKETKLTRTGATMGSPAYMAPEQVRAEQVDQRADVWAMGVTLFELLTGKLPFGEGSVPQMLAAILRDNPIPLRSLRPDVPAELEEVINCALSKHPDARYASAAELLDALSAVRARMPRTTPATRTLRMGQNLQLSRPEMLAETTDLNLRIIETDASRVRPRIIVTARADKETVTDRNRRTDRPSKHDARPHVWGLFIVSGCTILLGAIAGVVLSRRHQPPAPSAVVSVAQPRPSTAPVRTINVAPAASSAAPAASTVAPAASSVTPAAASAPPPTTATTASPRRPTAKPTKH